MSYPTYAYRYPCVVQDPLDPTCVFVLGVNGSAGTTLELTRVDISNINNPVPRRLNSETDATVWSSTADRACDIHPRDTWIQGVPTFYLRQFGGRSYMTNFLGNGSFTQSFSMNPPLLSSKLYSAVGAYGDHKWVTTVATAADSVTGSPWSGLDIFRNATGTWIYGSFQIQQYPPADARLSVGTFSTATNMPVFGYVTVFDSTGSNGQVFPTTSSFQTEESSTSLQALAAPMNVDMDGITLSADAISTTMGSTGYIVDKAADGSAVLYSISPDARSTPKLTRVAVSGNVPPFMVGRTSTVLDSNKLLLFGGLQNGTPTTVFHCFDSSTRTWSGPNLVKPSIPPPPPPTPSPNIGAIIGGVAAAVIVLGLALFFIIRRYRRPHHTVVLPNKNEEVIIHPHKGDPGAVIMTDIVYPPEHQYNQHHKLQHHQQHHQQQQQLQHSNTGFEPLVYSSEQPYKQPGAIFQPQEPVYHQRPAVLQPHPGAYQPHDAAYPQGSVYHTPPITTSVVHGGISPVISNTYTDQPSSTLSPATIHGTYVPVTTQLNSPQYIPPAHGDN
ncbi:hypothetical protein DFQ26_001411 [Actinomortierella ambigua]|nr:hypothetical protein DFQ26_001411 [Actinomortierella ambigua]